jgi:hypothetical protein
MIFEAAMAAGVQLRHMEPTHATLEAAFLRVVDQAEAARKQVRA